MYIHMPIKKTYPDSRAKMSPGGREVSRLLQERQDLDRNPRVGHRFEFSSRCPN